MDYDDCNRERSDLKIQFIKANGLVHDRFIVIDYGTKNEVVYHSGASEKDAGNKLMVISRYTDGVVKNAIDGVVDRLVKNEGLVLQTNNKTTIVSNTKPRQKTTQKPKKWYNGFRK